MIVCMMYILYCIFEYLSSTKLKLADRQGLEPRLEVPKTPVLPLHHQSTRFGGIDETRTRDLLRDRQTL